MSTFEACDDGTRLVMSERCPSKNAPEAAGTGAQDAMAETLGQLGELLAGLSGHRLGSR